MENINSGEKPKCCCQKKGFWWAVAIVAILGLGAFFFLKGIHRPTSATNQNGVAPTGQAPSITILWAQWAPSDYLVKLSEDFTKETGIKVNVQQESWSDFQNVFFNEMSKKGDAFDIVIGDSQWMGRGATEGHYIELTNWPQGKNIIETMTPASVAGYSEYPSGSGHYWGIPFEGDAMGFAYRKDLFEDPKEKEDFKKKYKRELKVPATTTELRDIAEFFYRPQKDFFGIIIWNNKDYDGVTMGIESFIWAFGGDLGDKKTYKVKGILNTSAAEAGLNYYKEIYQFSSPLWKNAYLDTNKGMMEGKVAMVMSYFAFFPELLDESKNPYAKSMGFFANPAGPKMRVSSLGGQGASVIAYSKKKDLSLQFLEWFAKEEVQQKWGKLGGYTCNKNVLNSADFLNAMPFNRPLMESMGMMKDFWAIPEYSKLLKVSQENFYKFMTEKNYSAKQALNETADQWETTFEEAGYYKE
ncbi:MAG: extracellular solute-binding protein [Pseudomonadota bacterium]